jgi:predicted RND superfamily exporter protein
MTVVTFAMFRKIVMTILPMLVVLLTAIWTYGFMSFWGFQINSISIIIRPLLMAVAIAGSMHILADYLQKAAEGSLSKVECIRRSFEDVAPPCFMASLTTAIGLLSLLTSDMRPIRELGLVAAVGVLFAFLIGMSLLPILLSITPAPTAKDHERVRGGFLTEVLCSLGRWPRNSAIAVVLLSLAAVVPAVLLLPQVSLGSHILRYLREDDDIRRQMEWIDANIFGTSSLELVVDADRENAFKDPSLLRKLGHAQAYLSDFDGVSGVYCGADLVRALNRAFSGGREDAYVIPSSVGEVTQQLFIIEGSEELEQFFSYDYSKARITVRVRDDRTRQIYDRSSEIERRVREIFGDRVNVTVTGTLYSVQQVDKYLVSGQIKSFLLAFVLIEVVMLIMLRSPKLGAYAMIPNFLPILFGTAMLPVLGIPLDIGTAMPAVVTLGLVVDDTIHFLSRLRLEMDRTDEIKDAVSRSLTHTGRPIVFTSMVLGLGFLAMLPAKFVPAANFGILSAIVIVLALVFDLIVLPALMSLVWSGRRQRTAGVRGASSDETTQ